MDACFVANDYSKFVPNSYMGSPIYYGIDFRCRS